FACPLFFLLRLERKILLSEVAEGHDDKGGQYLCHRREDVELLHKKLDENVVESQAGHYQHEIAEQLHRSMQCEFTEHHVAHEKESGGETDAEGNKERQHIGRDRYKSQVDIMLVKDEVIADIIHENIQQCI